MAKAKNVSHEMEIWKQLIDTEMKTAANWEGQWGFLKGGVQGMQDRFNIDLNDFYIIII